MEDLSRQKQKELAEAHTLALYEGTLNSTNSVLEQEEAVRKDLVDAMVNSSTPSNGPVVKVLTNVQGNLSIFSSITEVHYYSLIYHNKIT